MCRVLDNSLFVKDRKKYIKISECATSFNSLYNKNNIIQRKEYKNENKEKKKFHFNK